MICMNMSFNTHHIQTVNLVKYPKKNRLEPAQGTTLSEENIRSQY